MNRNNKANSYRMKKNRVPILHPQKCASCAIRKRLKEKASAKCIGGSSKGDGFQLTQDRNGLAKAVAGLKRCPKCRNDKNTLYGGRVVDCQGGSEAMRRAADLPKDSARQQTQNELSCVLQVLGELARSEVSVATSS
jgi:hypothetical protein